MSAYTHHGDCSTSGPCRRCFQFGETTERKRIIELLENKQLEMTLPDGTVYVEFLVLHDIIDAIKGGNE